MGEIASRIAALEARIAAAQNEARLCVNELVVDDGARFLIAERLPGLGTAILPSVHELLADPDVDAEVRGLAALCGLAVGDSGPSVVALFEEIEHLGPLAPLAARTMAERRVPGAASAALAALRSTDAAEVDSIVTYLGAIRTCGGNLPAEERARLEAGGTWQVTSALRELFPVDQP